MSATPRCEIAGLGSPGGGGRHCQEMGAGGYRVPGWRGKAEA